MFGWGNKSANQDPMPQGGRPAPPPPPPPRQQYQGVRWRGRMFAGIIMLLLAFIGLIITNIYPDNSWIYWAVLAVVYALICIWLSLFLRRSSAQPGHSNWREIIHWIALLCVVYMVVIQVNSGIVGTMEGGLLILTMLALSTFYGGLYIDGTFMLVGIVLGLFVISITLIQVYLTLVAIPIIIVSAIIVYFISRYKRNRYG